MELYGLISLYMYRLDELLLTYGKNFMSIPELMAKLKMNITLLHKHLSVCVITFFSTNHSEVIQ